MHFKREQIIDGVKFVAVPEAWLEKTLHYLTLKPAIEVAEVLEEASHFSDILDNLPATSKEKPL
jgi:hypothetical protein